MWKQWYYDNHEVPYKIERKYSDTNGITYIRHSNEGSVCVKQQTYTSGDTTILKEGYYHIFHKKTKIEVFQDCDGFTQLIDNLRDTVWIKGYKIEYSPYKMIFVCDTILTGDAAKNSGNFSERIKNARVPCILNGQITVMTDSLILKETVVAHFLKNIPVKVEVFDEQNKKYSTVTSLIHKNKIIYKNYSTKDGRKPYQKDIFSFNADTTHIRKSSTHFERKQTVIFDFQISGAILKINFSSKMKREVEYIDAKYIFSNILAGDLIYSDVLYYIELRHFNREKPLRITTNTQTSTNKYSFDSKKRIVEQLSYTEGQLQKKILYTYEN